MSGLGIFIALLGLGLLILVHEFGHFFVAKLLNIKILEFMVGLPLGPKILKIKRKETTYGMTAALLGGYVKFAEFFPSENLVVEKVLKGSPSEKAGFKKRDRLLRFNDVVLKDWEHFATFLKENKGRKVKITLLRRDKEIDLFPQLTPEGFLGLGPAATDETSLEDLPRTLEAQSPGKKFLMVAAGPLMNLLLAVLLMAFALMIGFSLPTTKVEKVMPESPAAQIGIRSGDQVISIGNRTIKEWQDVTNAIRQNAGKKVTVRVKREGRFLKFTPTLRKKSPEGLLGIVSKLERQPKGFFGAFYESIIFVFETSILILVSIGRLIATPLRLIHQLRGPIGIITETAPVAQRDLLQYLGILSGISIAIGIFNLLPLPPLDGGRLLVSSVEAVTKRPLSREVLTFVNFLGVTVLLLLFTYVVVSDIFRLTTPGGG